MLFNKGKSRPKARAEHVASEEDFERVVTEVPQIGAVNLLKQIRYVFEAIEGIEAQAWGATSVGFRLKYHFEGNGELADIGREIDNAHAEIMRAVEPLKIAANRLSRVICKEERDAMHEAAQRRSVFDDEDPFGDDAA